VARLSGPLVVLTIAVMTVLGIARVEGGAPNVAFGAPRAPLNGL